MRALAKSPRTEGVHGKRLRDVRATRTNGAEVPVIAVQSHWRYEFRNVGKRVERLSPSKSGA